MFLILLVAQSVPLASNGDEVGRKSIYFDSDTAAEIRPEWISVLDGVAAGVRRVGARVRVDGFSDRSGSGDANRRVSKQRAETVRRALIERGVPASSIVSVAHGEDSPVVPTLDGVRDPQNRRVDITLLP